ncbi:glycosyltransferase [Lactococcus lactis]|uniref:Minor teichoic acid biosynthesis protein GgaB n=1 Tax=Lactococcus lactis subsp. lactis TaxID=1360 RepID=A0A2N5WFA4_LACLL|nr:glycosyltransferase family 2 protein [Lactococcus lactis]PLW60928.1 Minor teichoic acid biosynthesis protein GgaB [Lactococcus lactis subsp. lactis]
MFKFSIIIPYKNNNNWLNDLIESIITQTLDFYSNVEIILINNNSSNFSKEIADYWQQLFPLNIKSLSSNSSDFTSIYDTALKTSFGEHVIFLDENILFKEDILEKVDDFYRNYPDLKIVSVPLGDLNGAFDELNEKYYRSREIIIKDEPQSILVNKTNIFINRSLIHYFESPTFLWDEALSLTEIVMKEGRYGVISNSQLYYREGRDPHFLIQHDVDELQFYTIFNEKVSKIWLEKYKKADEIPQYIQNVLVYIIQWAISKGGPPILSIEEIKEFRRNYIALMNNVSIENILILHQLSQRQKLFLIKENLKYNRKEFKYFFDNQDINLFGDEIFLDSLSKSTFEITSIITKKNRINLLCKLNTMFDSEQISLYLNSQEDKYSKELKILQDKEVILFGEVVEKELTFEVSIPSDDSNFKLTFISIRAKDTVIKLRLSNKSFQQFSKLLLKTKIKNISYDTLKDYFIIKIQKEVSPNKKKTSKNSLVSDIKSVDQNSRLTLYQKIKKRLPRSFKRKMKKFLKKYFHITIGK